MQKTAIELFSGTGTVSKVLEKNAWNVISIDNNPKFHPSICCDILKITPEMLPGMVQFIWASPVCTHFSRAASVHHWNKETKKYRKYNYFPLTKEAHNSVALLNKTIQIIQWYPTAWFVIENPVGRIPHFSALRNLAHYRYQVNYADWNWPHSKETYLFTNFLLPFGTKRRYTTKPGLRSVRNVIKRSQVPPELIQFIADRIPT